MAIAVDLPSGDAGADGPVVEEFPEQVQGQPPPDDVAARTYFLLRWSMPVMLVWLVIAMGWEWWSVWQSDDMAYPMTSISAYYYTSAQPVFVGVLIGLGVLLIVIQGRTPWEDALMNTAGALAPFVALFPTPVDAAKDCTEAYCTSVILKAANPAGIPNNHELIEFNVVAVAPIWAILTFYLAHLGIQGYKAKKSTRLERAAPIASALAVFASGVVALRFWVASTESQEVFFKWAHLASAGTMVALLLLSIIPFAGWARRSDYRIFHMWGFKILRNGFGAFLALAIALLIACGLLIVYLTPAGWNHKVLVIEAAALVPFAVYWVMQGFALRTHDRHPH